MRLTTSDISILKNLSTLNDNIILKPGKKQQSLSPTKSVLAQTTLDIDIPETIVIFSLKKFLSLYRCISNPQLEVVSGHTLRIYNETSEESITYRLSDESLVQKVPEKELKLPSTDVTVEVTNSQLKQCVKIAATLAVDTLAITGDGEDIFLEVLDKKNSAADSYKVRVGETTDIFSFSMKLENLKVMDGDYEVSISEKNLSFWASKSDDIQYFIAMEPDSFYESSGVEVEPKVEEVTEDSYQPYKGSEEVTEEELMEMVN